MLQKWSIRARIVLLLICLTQFAPISTGFYRTGKIGCLFDSYLCDKNEFCHNDGSKGICLVDRQLGSDEDTKENDNVLSNLNDNDQNLNDNDDKDDKDELAAGNAYSNDDLEAKLKDCISNLGLKYARYRFELGEENYLNLLTAFCNDYISTGNEPKIPLDDNVEQPDLKDYLLSNSNLRNKFNLNKPLDIDSESDNRESNLENFDQKPNYPEIDSDDDYQKNRNENLNDRLTEINRNINEAELFANLDGDLDQNINKKLDQKKPGPFILDDIDDDKDDRKRFDDRRFEVLSNIDNGYRPDGIFKRKIGISNPTPINQDHKPVEEGAVHVEMDKDGKEIKLVEPTGPGEQSNYAAIDSSYAFAYFKKSKKSIASKKENDNQVRDFLSRLEKKLGLQTGSFANIDPKEIEKEKYLDCAPFPFIHYLIKFDEDEINCDCKILTATFKVEPNGLDLNATVVADVMGQYPDLQEETGLIVIQTGIGDKVKIERKRNCNVNLLKTFINLSLIALAVILVIFLVIFYHRRDSLKQKIHNAVYGAPVLVGWFTGEKDYTQCNLASKPQKLSKADLEKQALDYQDLCRQRMKANEQSKKSILSKTDDSNKLIKQASKNQPALEKCKTQQKSQSAVTQPQQSPANDPLMSTAMNMDISTGHLILEYMENHLKQNGDKLTREWNALNMGTDDYLESTQNAAKLAAYKNLYPNDPSTWPYDSSRVLLNDLESKDHIDYINASTIIDSDPNPIYIATQGPLKDTISDFWQMVWEQGSSVIVMLTRLVENGVEQSARYWPEKGSERYLHFEVNLVSEHIWSEQYLVRSLYLKNQLKNESRTVTMFHFVAWPENSVPSSPAALLEFRRKVNKSYRERSSPIIVHCSDGCNRTGAYCLIDMVLNRLTKGVKEIDLAATLEHLRDQRPSMIRDQQKFEFCLKAIAEEVHNYLRSLQQK